MSDTANALSSPILSTQSAHVSSASSASSAQLPHVYREMLAKLPDGALDILGVMSLCGVTQAVVDTWDDLMEILVLEWEGIRLYPYFQFVGPVGRMHPSPGMRGIIQEFEHAFLDRWTVLRFLMSLGITGARQGIPDVRTDMEQYFGYPCDGASHENAMDVVNEHDVVIGTLPRRLVHDRWLLHRFVHVMVQNSEGCFLLQRRSMRKEKGPGLFDASVGGHVDAGETYEQAMRREAGEELGLDSAGDFIEIGDIRDFTPGVENMVGKLFLHYSNGPFTGWEEEADQIQWVTRSELAFLVNGFSYLFTSGMVSSANLLLTM